MNERDDYELKSKLLEKIGVQTLRDTSTNEPLMWRVGDYDHFTPEDAIWTYLEKLNVK